MKLFVIQPLQLNLISEYSTLPMKWRIFKVIRRLATCYMATYK